MGFQQTAKRLCMLPRTLDHGSDLTRRQTFEVMMPALIKHGLLRRCTDGQKKYSVMDRLPCSSSWLNARPKAGCEVPLVGCNMEA